MNLQALIQKPLVPAAVNKAGNRLPLRGSLLAGAAIIALPGSLPLVVTLAAIGKRAATAYGRNPKKA